MPDYILNRDFTLRSTSGRSIKFLKGVATHVPRFMEQEVAGIGGVPADGSDVFVGEPVATPTAPEDPVTREGMILQAIVKIAQMNQRGDFTAAGAPHADALYRELKFKIDNKERDALWQKYRNLEAEKTAK
jgi:hypothetical protein